MHHGDTTPRSRLPQSLATILLDGPLLTNFSAEVDPSYYGPARRPEETMRYFEVLTLLARIVFDLRIPYLIAFKVAGVLPNGVAVSPDVVKKHMPECAVIQRYMKSALAEGVITIVGPAKDDLGQAASVVRNLMTMDLRRSPPRAYEHNARELLSRLSGQACQNSFIEALVSLPPEALPVFLSSEYDALLFRAPAILHGAKIHRLPSTDLLGALLKHDLLARAGIVAPSVDAIVANIRNVLKRHGQTALFMRRSARDSRNNSERFALLLGGVNPLPFSGSVPVDDAATSPTSLPVRTALERFNARYPHLGALRATL